MPTFLKLAALNSGEAWTFHAIVNKCLREGMIPTVGLCSAFVGRVARLASLFFGGGQQRT